MKEQNLLKEHHLSLQINPDRPTKYEFQNWIYHWMWKPEQEVVEGANYLPAEGVLDSIPPPALV